MAENSFEQYLNIRSAWAPAFGPSGKHIAFLTDITGVPEVWAIDSRGGWPHQLTFGGERVSTVEWSPSGESILFARDRGGDECHQLFLLTLELGQTGLPSRGPVPLTDEDDVMNIFGSWSPDDRYIAYAANSRDRAFFDVYVKEVPDGEPRLVYQQDGSNTTLRWSPDGGGLLVSHASTNLYNDLLVVDVATGEARSLTAHSEQAAYSSVQWSRNGRKLYMATNLDREFKALAEMDVSSGAVRWIAEPDGDVETVALSPNGRRLTYTINDSGYAQTVIREMKTGDEHTVRLDPAKVDDRLFVETVSWSGDSRRLAMTTVGARHNRDVWVYDVPRRSAHQVTQSAKGGIDRGTFVRPELVTFPTFDGRDIPAFLYTPDGARNDGANSVVVHVHGGPEGQERPVFNPVYQYLVSRGHCVLAPNVRGSLGYGRTYVHLDDVRKRMDSVHDLKHAWQWLIESGWADPKRVAVMGGSYGGFMTLSAITTYPDLWAAAVDLVGISNWLTFLENTSSYRRKLRAAEYGDPVEDADFLREVSPITHIENVRAPLLVIHGARDPRVPITETEQLVEAVRALELPVEYLRFEDEGHGVVKRANRLKAYPAIAEFLGRHLGVV